ncbi:hypothetical protein LDK17_08945 [Fusobacterium polymorphum]|uniref:hypothetical protein n=1 Tax=Fusobacterium nucleatum subsp. polymorphum TaxID=76857 RepID=UPI0030CBA240
MKENLDKNTTIKEIVERYLKQENMSIYKFSKESTLSVKTIKKILKNTNSNFNKTTIKKLYVLKRLNLKDKKFIEILLDKKNSKKSGGKKDRIFEKILNKMEDLIEENEMLKQKVNMYSITKKENLDYISKRKVGAFGSDLESNSLLITKIWDFNENILKQWADVKLLLDINNKEKTKKMKKGLKSIASELKKIVDYLENIYFDSSEIKESEIINMEEKE